MTPEQLHLLVQLTQLQHHLDDAEVYSGTGHQDAAHLSLDDAEEGVERIGETVLPPEGQEQLEEVEEQGDEEEEEAGIEEEGHEQEDQELKVASFQLGMDVLCRQLGIVGERRELFKKVAQHVAMGRVKTAQDVLECVGSLGGTPNPKVVKRADADARLSALPAAKPAPAEPAAHPDSVTQRSYGSNDPMHGPRASQDWQSEASSIRARMMAEQDAHRPANPPQALPDVKSYGQKADAEMRARQEQRSAALAAQQKAIQEAHAAKSTPLQAQIAEDQKRERSLQQARDLGVAPDAPQLAGMSATQINQHIQRSIDPSSRSHAQSAPAQAAAQQEMDPFSIAGRDLKGVWQSVKQMPSDFASFGGWALNQGANQVARAGQGVVGGLTHAARAIGAPQAVNAAGSAVQSSVQAPAAVGQAANNAWNRFGQGGSAWRQSRQQPQQSIAAKPAPQARPLPAYQPGSKPGQNAVAGANQTRSTMNQAAPSTPKPGGPG